MHPQRGQSSIEYVSALALVGVLLGLAATVSGAPVANAVTRGMQRALCTVTGARCTTLTPQPCTVRTTTLTGAVGVKFTVLRVGRDSAIVRSESSDGSISITLLDRVDAGVQAALGAKGKVALGGQTLGGGTMAQASLIGRLGGGRTWTVRGKADADALVRKLQAVLAGRVASSTPGVGPVINLGQRLLHKGSHAKLPTADSRTYTAGLELEAKALLGPLKDANGSFGGLLGMRTDRDGAKTWMFTLDGTVAGPLAKAAGTEGTGSGEVSLALTHDRHGGLKELTVSASGEVSRTTGLSPKTLATGRGKGRSATLTATLDLTDPEDRARAQALLDALRSASPTRAAAAVAGLAAAVADHAAVDVSTYATKEDTYGFDLAAGAGVQAGVQAEYSRNRTTLSGAWSRPPHGVWEARLDCRV